MSHNQQELSLNKPKPDRKKYRGKAVKDGEWYYGHFIVRSGRFGPMPSIFIDSDDLCEYGVFHRVDYRTVGQCIGISDVNGVEIFEGDFFEFNNGHILHPNGVVAKDIKTCGHVYWDEYLCTYVLSNQHKDFDPIIEMRRLPIIGNVHDNPEQVEGFKS